MRIRSAIVSLALLAAPLSQARAQVQFNVGVTVPGVSIGLAVPAYPELVPVPGYPVYYAPNVAANFFFYDGLYWVYRADRWYSAAWYDGPWHPVAPEVVPAFVLRVPVGYYRSPPAYFRGWRPDQAPRWGEHWGRDWQHRRAGWDRWDRGVTYRPAPLPAYQRDYHGDRYPRSLERQVAIRDEHGHGRPHEDHDRGHDRGHGGGRAPDHGHGHEHDRGDDHDHR